MYKFLTSKYRKNQSLTVHKPLKSFELAKNNKTIELTEVNANKQKKGLEHLL